MPNWGRYVEADPIGLAGGLNPYAYGGGTPMESTDKLGLCDKCDNNNNNASNNSNNGGTSGLVTVTTFCNKEGFCVGANFVGTLEHPLSVNPTFGFGFPSGASRSVMLATDANAYATDLSLQINLVGRDIGFAPGTSASSVVASKEPGFCISYGFPDQLPAIQSILSEANSAPSAISQWFTSASYAFGDFRDTVRNDYNQLINSLR